MAGQDTHLAKLVLRHAGGRSIKEIERANGLNEGALGYYLKPSSPGRKHLVPRLDVMERFATALGASLDEVSQAFVRDAGLRGGNDDYTAQECELLHRFRGLHEVDQARLLAIVDVFEQHQHRNAEDVR